MSLEILLQETLDAVIGQFDNYAFFVGVHYKEELKGITEFCGYPIFLVLIIDPKDETIYFAPMTHFYTTTMN